MCDFFPDSCEIDLELCCGSGAADTASCCPKYPIPADFCDPDDYGGSPDDCPDQNFKPPKITYNVRELDDTPKSINTRFLKVSRPIYNNANRAKPDKSNNAQSSAPDPRPRSKPRKIVSANDPKVASHKEVKDDKIVRKEPEKTNPSPTSTRTPTPKTPQHHHQPRKSPKPLSLGRSTKAKKENKPKKSREKSNKRHKTKSPGKIFKSTHKSKSRGRSKTKGKSVKTKSNSKSKRAKKPNPPRPPTPTKKSNKKKSKSKSSSSKGNKSRGRSGQRSGRKPRGPPPTPVAIDEKKRKYQLLALLEKFNKHALETGLGSEESSKLSNLRGYSSEPDVSRPCPFKLSSKRKKRKPRPTTAKLTKSLDEMYIDKRGYPLLMNPNPYSDEDFKEISISPNVWHKWHEYFEMENKRFSFYDELYSRKYITDSMEVPGNSTDISYLIEADDMDYRTKVDYGRIVVKTKHVYTGNFVDWYFQGPGRYVWLDGSVYQGDFVNGVMHGEGTLLWPNGSIYEGQFREGVRGGLGVYSTSKGYIYSGDWLQGLPHGKGKFWYDPIQNPGNFYEGELIKGQPHGFGIRNYRTGERYAGYWVNGQREGYGTMFWQEEKQMYKGQWLKGHVDGDGIHAWFAPKPSDKDQGPEAPGDFKKGKQPPPPPPPPLVRFVFKGRWKKGARQGTGRIYYPNGSVYEGTWDSGKQVGEGNLIDPSGEVLTGLDCQHADQTGFRDLSFDRTACECLFSRLVTALYKKIPLKSCENRRKDEKDLINLCFDNMHQFKLLYQRAIDLGAMWSNYTLASKPTHPSKDNKKCFQPSESQKTNLEFGNAQSIFSKFNQMESHQSNQPATRFGLWLLVKDFKNVGKQISLTTLDESWGITDTNTFMQCLVVLVFEYLVVIPLETSRAKYKCKREKEKEEMAGFSKTEEKVPKRSSRFSKSSSKRTSQNSSGSRKRPNKNKTKKTAPRPKGNVARNTKNAKKLASKQALLSVNPSDDDFIDVPRDDDGTVSRPPSELLSTEEHQTDIDGEDPLQPNSSEEDIYGSFPTCKDALCIGELVNNFLVAEVSQCFCQIAGKNLPHLPNSLPPIKDLFEMFKSIKQQETITASDFLYSILPHRIFPDSHRDRIYWTRVDEILSSDVDYDFLFNYTKQMETWEDSKETMKQRRQDLFQRSASSGNDSNSWEVVEDFGVGSEHGDDASGVKMPQVSTEINNHPVDINNNREVSYDGHKSLEGPVEPPIKYCGQTKQTGEVPKEDTEKAQKMPDKLRMYDDDGLPYIEFELMMPDTDPPPTDELPLERVQLEKPRSLSNLGAEDVVGVLRYIYPGLCGQATETNLEFKMLFCDWLWCIILCTQVSIEKERLLEGRVKFNRFEVSNTKNIVHQRNMEKIRCCQSKKVNDEIFFQDHILNVFYKHQELRRGEKWISNRQSHHSDNNYQAVQSSSMAGKTLVERNENEPAAS